MRCFRPMGACARRWLTCSPAAGRSRSRPPGSAARSRPIELNPVAHLIERCMLEYPQRLPGLAADVRRWGRSGSTAPGTTRRPLPTGRTRLAASRCSADRRAVGAPLRIPVDPHVRCPNPALREHRVAPLRQTWLARKKGPYDRPQADRRPIESDSHTMRSWRPHARANLGFDPALDRAAAGQLLDLRRRGYLGHVKSEGIGWSDGDRPACRCHA